MTERPQDEPRPGKPAYDDPTRDIRLPALPDRPPPAMPRAWAGLTSQPSPDTRAPDFSAPPPQVVPSPETEVEAPDRPPRPRANPLADQPTDELGTPEAQPRERTLAFSSPEMSHRPAGPVQVARTPRRWPWVLLVLVPILVIAGTGIALLVLLQGG